MVKHVSLAIRGVDGATKEVAVLTPEYGGEYQVILHQLQMTNIDLKPIAICTQLRLLDLAQNQLHSLDLSPLTGCINLQNLNLENNQLENLDLLALSSCTQLQELNLKNNRLHDLDLLPLASCNQLHRLVLYGNELQGLDLSPLASCPQLHELVVDGNQLQSLDLSPLAKCTWLESLGVSDNRLSNIDLSALAGCTRLQSLDLENNRLRDIGLSPLAGCSELFRLLLYGNRLESIDLSPLAHCLRLEELTLSGNPLKSIDIDPLFACTRLSKLYIDDGVALVGSKRPLSTDIVPPAIQPYQVRIISPSIWSRTKFEAGRTVVEPVVARGVESTPTPAPKPVVTPRLEAQVEALRGGEFIGNRFRYKVKVLNKSDFVITDILVTLLSYPKGTLKLDGERTKAITKVDPKGFVSPTFDFLPTQDCVQGEIVASVSYVDPRGQPCTIATEPFVVRAVCDLLIPEMISPEQFGLRLTELGHGEMVVKVRDWTPEEMHSKSLQILEKSNFFDVGSSRRGVGAHVESRISGWARGKYTRKSVGTEITVTGRPGVKGSTCKVRMFGEDQAMIMPAIDEISQKLAAWLCPMCGGKLTSGIVDSLKDGKSSPCPFCGVTVGC